MNFDGVDDDSDSRDDEDLPSSIVVDRSDEQLSPIAPSVVSEQVEESLIKDFKSEQENPSSEIETDEDDDDDDDDDDDALNSSSTSSDSLDLNPNSSVDKLDLPGIALLKEIFPEETTNSLRKMHYKHILLNKTSPYATSSPMTPELLSGHNSTENSMMQKNTTQEPRNNDGDQGIDETREQNSAIRQIPVSNLPEEDFLRLPKSVAIIRKREVHHRGNSQVYEFIKDLEMQALEEYHLAGANQHIHPSGKYVEYITYVVDKDDHFGLGMTLQEVIEEWNPLGALERSYLAPGSHFVMGHVPQDAVIRFGLMVIGFLQDPKNNQGRNRLDRNFQSPAEVAGIKCDDVVIGINGAAFLLQMPLSSSSSYTIDRRSDHYKTQKKRIIQSIQNSPSPVVLHIRRKRQRSPIEKSFIERNTTSLLDTSTMEDLGRDDLREENIDAERVEVRASSSIQRHSVSAFQSSLSSVFHSTTPASVSRMKSRANPHPLSVALAHRKLIRPGEDQWRITRRLKQFTERARQFESSNSLRIFLTERGNGERGSLAPHFDPIDLPPDMAAMMLFQKDDVTGSTNEARQKDMDADLSRSKKDYNGRNQQEQEENDVYIESRSFMDNVRCTSSTPTLPVDSPLIPMEYLQAFYGDRRAKEIRSMADCGNLNLQTAMKNSDDMAWIPLHGIRKGLSARIVNSFVESASSNSGKNSYIQSRIAYTIWVYDIESGREWYAPIRYWKDFSDLREAALNSLPTNSNIQKELSALRFAKDPTIPNDNNSGWGASVFGSPSMLSPMRRKRRNDDFDEARQQTSQSLEEFLRELLGIIYTCHPLHTSTAEIALYVQSFLGVDAGLEDHSESFLDMRTFSSPSERLEDQTRKHLKRSIQRYSWRVFLLHSMKAIVNDFVCAARARGPKLHEIEFMDTDTKELKARAMDELLQIQKFLDQLVDLILDGCHDDLESLAKRREYSSIHKNLQDESYWDRLVREAVREQVEIEVYVPLRSVVSRLLVNGWRHEDMEVHFKIKELRKRPQGMFRIEKISPSHWQSVARILKQGVGMSTLPCVKLRAIVDAAREISQLHETEHGGQELLGADEFLPIFIFCVVRAEMERPCALSILLQTLCDRINRIGEIGYFLASFEAAIAHIEGIDLAEDRDDMLSFLNVPLTEVSLDE